MAEVFCWSSAICDNSTVKLFETCNTPSRNVSPHPHIFCGHELRREFTSSHHQNCSGRYKRAIPRATSRDGEDAYSSVPTLSTEAPVTGNGAAVGEIDPDVRSVQDGRLTRAEALKLVDASLNSGNDDKALALVRALQGRPGGLRAFGAASQVPQRSYTLDELRLHKIDTSRFLSPKDSTLSGIRQGLQLAAILGGLATWQLLHLDQSQLIALVVSPLFVATLDQIANGGGGEALVLDTLGNAVSGTYRARVGEHEAGHFLVSYLVGILPRTYTLSSLDAFQRYGALNIQAGTTFVDNEFQREVASGKMSSGTLDKFSCVALAGVATEYIKYEEAEGGLSDIQQLDVIFKSLGFTQKKADSQVRWAVLNTVTLLRRHMATHEKLAMAMSESKSIGDCIEILESSLANMKDL